MTLTHVFQNLILQMPSNETHSLQLEENYYTWNKNIYIYIYVTQDVCVQHIGTLQYVFLLLHGKRLIDNQYLSTSSPTCFSYSDLEYLEGVSKITCP
jgi:hypothetical protein